MRGFRYLKSDTVTLDNVDEAESLRNTLDAMSIVGLLPAEQARTNLTTGTFTSEYCIQTLDIDESSA